MPPVLTLRCRRALTFSRDGSGAVLRIDEQLDEPDGVCGLSMCRLFGMSAGREPARATFWLLEAPDSIATQSHREPDGTGLGWFDGDGAPHISKQPIAAYGDAEFAREAHEVCSRTFIAHIRFASTGDTCSGRRGRRAHRAIHRS